MPGRRPLPTAIKELRGNPGKRPLANELVVPANSPEMPHGLGRIARTEWKRIVPLLLEIKVLSTLDRAALAAYCTAYQRWILAELEIQKRGLLVESPTGPRKNPAVTISDHAMKLMKSFLIEFGMTPAARTRIQMEPPCEHDPIAEKYFRERPRV